MFVELNVGLIRWYDFKSGGINHGGTLSCQSGDVIRLFLQRNWDIG